MPLLKLVVNTKVCETCFKETQEYHATDGVIQCRDCVTGVTAEKVKEDEEWAKFERILAENANKGAE